MPRILGVNIPEQKKVEMALQSIYGIGPVNVKQVLQQSRVSGEKRAKDLTDQEVSMISRVLDEMTVEGRLRKSIIDNVQRLKQIRCYRGLRHMRRLPVRGQRTRVNARTRRGRKMTVGALTKEAAAKMQAAKK